MRKEATAVFGPNLLAMLITGRFLRSDAAAACQVRAACIGRLLSIRRLRRIASTTKLNRAGCNDQYADCRKQRQRLECPDIGH
jgi:hypothetical protein